jgi:tungstate transport system ATP-binding protein
MNRAWQFTGLQKAFGNRTLFNIPKLMLEGGHAYVITGVNGAGKTTLLRMMGGLDPTPGARVEHDGLSTELAAMPRGWRENIGYVHQHPYLFATTVFDNIAYGLRAHRKSSVETAVQAAIQWAGVGHVCDVPPQQLSGGEKQRVALARAYVLNSALMLLDEPTANLDGDARERVLELIGDLREQGRTVVVVCHDRDVINLPDMQRLKLADGELELRP